MHYASGYVDLQVNGYADVDFNRDDLTTENVLNVCDRLRSEGVAGILATVITADVDSMCRRLACIRRVRESDQAIADMIWGIHIEGPFLRGEVGYIGAHPVEFAREADIDIMKRLIEASGGLTRLVTLAPEQDSGNRVTSYLAKAGIRVAAGHCNSTLDELRSAIDAGLSVFTHLGNGCPRQLPRHDNIIQRALSLADHLHFGFIADGVHVPFFALGNYLKCCGIDRAFVVTDAICGAGLGPGEYSIGSRRLVIDNNLATWSTDHSHLIGSAGTMQRSAENLRTALALEDEDIRRLLSENPRKLMDSSFPR